MATTDIPPDLSNAAGIAELISLMRQQISVLNRIDQRQAAADVSAQPFPQVPGTSSSVWGALLRSRITETIQPQVDRWRSGLDALLVFLGLFSAIVTSFLVDSLPGLQQDEAARTNELLANLTEILIQLNTGANLLTLKTAAPAPFQPDAVDVRLNSYWSISLILSLSVAALAVACRGFLNMATLSRHPRALDKLMDINTRWKGAEKMLGPTLEIIPQLLIIPVILFVVGLLDAIFTRILGLEVLPTPIAAASGLSLFFITGITAFLVFALVHASSRHDSSPFQSTLARFISNVIDKAFGVDPRMRGVKRGRIRELYTRNIYHEIVQATHDDETLDKAVTALGTLGWRSWSDNLNNTFVHLLSPEASIRCNQTAARVIVDLEELFKSNGSTRLLLSDLARAAYRRAENNRPATLWTSTYIKAYAVIARAFRKDYPPVLCILGSDYATRPTKRLMSMDDLLLDIFFDYIDLVSPDGFPTPPMVQLFEPDFIVPRNVLRFIDRPYISLEEFESGSRDNRISVIISLLMAAKTPAVVMAAAREQIIEGGFSGIMVDFLVVKAVLQLPEESAEWQDTHMLEGLCSLCLDVAKSRSHRNHIPATVNATLTRLPPTGAASTALTGLLADLRQSHDPAQIWAS